MVWGRSHELVELAQFDAGGPRYPGGPRENRVSLTRSHDMCLARRGLINDLDDLLHGDSHSA